MQLGRSLTRLLYCTQNVFSENKVLNQTTAKNKKNNVRKLNKKKFYA